MLQSLLNSSTIPLLEKVAVFSERRQEVLAGNIANIDTPNYKTRDLPVNEFQEALKQAVVQRRQLDSPGRASFAESPQSRPLSQIFSGELFQARRATPANLTFQDGGNRSIEHEMMEMSKNLMMQNFAVELMTAQMNLLQSVISEKP